MNNRVFLSGSISTQTLPSSLIEKLDGFLDENVSFLVGDAPGADLLFQNYLSQRNAKSVTVFHSGRLRNNVGDWSTKYIESNLQSVSKESHGYKDRAMCSEATLGVVIWDRRSAGTLANIIDLVNQGKSSYVFFQDGSETPASSLADIRDRFQAEAELLAMDEANKRLARFRRRESLAARYSNPTLF